MSGKFGYLYPVLLMDCVPGDTVRDTMTAFMRFAPLLSPVMHRIDVTTHFFFVPMRLVTDHWETFITGGQDGMSETVLPYATVASYVAATDITPGLRVRKGTLWDYLGLPVLEGAVPGSVSVEPVSVLPFRAYAKVWNDYYRDPNFDEEEDLDLELDGPIATPAILEKYTRLRRRGWQKDYFTSALPWAQRGPSVLMPLSGTAEWEYRNPARLLGPDSGPYEQGDGHHLGIDNTLESGALVDLDSVTPANQPLGLDNISDIRLENGTTTINDLRRALAIQRWLENNARGGGRYIEQIEAHFGSRVPDFRLQRAEYLGGGKQPVQISEVLATAGGESQPPIGDMGGHGISVGKSNRFTYRCQEHGYVIGILSVMPQTAYQQGIDRLWSRINKYEYLWPELARLGEQEIKSKEVFFSFNNADQGQNDELFGYTPRYAEYKFKNDRVAGDFRDTLAFWHLGRIFTHRPILSSEFTTMFEDTFEGNSEEETYRRIFAVQDDTDYLWMQLFHRLTAKRPLPYFGVPSIM